MKKLTWIIVAVIVVLAVGFALIYKTRLKHYTLPVGGAPDRPIDEQIKLDRQ